MANEIPLKNIPCQELQVTINDKVCDITLSQREGILLMDLLIDDNTIFKGVVCKANINLLTPFAYKERNLKLFFSCKNSFFDYTQLGNSAKLYYEV